MTLITPFDPWHSKICTCPIKYSLSPYTGCGHGCLYCYASSYIPNFFTPRPKKDFLSRLKKEVKKLPPGTYITIANSSDPYLPMEQKLQFTRSTLEILKEHKFKIMLVTKSDLITRDIDLLKEINVVVSFTITTFITHLAKKLEPHAPPPMVRLGAIEKLTKTIPVVCRLDPLIYPLNTEIRYIKSMIKTLKNTGVKQIITSTYKAKPDNLKRMMNAFPEHKRLWEKLYLSEGTKKGRYIYMPEKLREELILAVREETIRNRMAFSSCRESKESLNTTVCDGSSFFK